MTIIVIAGLSIDWKEHPKVQGNTLSGSVVVTNHTGQDFDLTVVVVGVNSFALAELRPSGINTSCLPQKSLAP